MSRDWFERVGPPVPEAFVPWLRLEGADATDPSEGAAEASPGPARLEGAAVAALARALEPGGDRPRRGAFDLLAADAFLTYASRLLLDGAGDPVVGLRELAARTARRAP